ncbi:putative ATP-dependent RNA helicase DHR1 [Coemansia sp. RSA 1933]|nr:putative ATP-dependent RNA helicase DHR1 [Coemansia sp. RSA 1933]
MGTNKSTKQKRFQKFVEKQVKKEERAALLEKLSTSTWKNGLMRSSKNLGRQTDTKREKLQRAVLEENLGWARSDPNVRLYVSERDPDEVGRQADRLPSIATDSVTKIQPEETLGKKKRKRNRKSNIGDIRCSDAADDIEDSDIEVQMTSIVIQEPGKDSATVDTSKRQTAAETVAGSALATTAIVKRKRQKKGHILKKLGLSKHQGKNDKEEDESADDGMLVIGGMMAEDRPDNESAGTSGSEFDSSASESDEDEDEVEPEHGDSSVNTGYDDERIQAEYPVHIGEKPRLESKKTYYSGSMLKPLLTQRGVISSEPRDKTVGKAYYVSVKRTESIQEQRTKLPVYAEEQQIMEAISENTVLVLSGETGSGKTTQVPQFLFEAGYGDPDSPNPGMIGITQPRRVAAVSMSSRVAEELGDHGSTVAHQVRFDTTVSNKTRIKFMTEGVLLREMASDLLLTKYSALIIDEAHERSLNTDILLGVLSRVVRLRHRMAQESPEKHRPLKLIIMSATLRVDDFVKNSRLFSKPPPVINVQARQHPVRVHFNRRTPAPGQHLGEVIKKVGKIHQRLPDGGILVFLTGQAEITHVCKMLQAQFPTEAERKISGECTGERAQSGFSQAANGLEASIEDEDVDIGNIDVYVEDRGDLHDDFVFDSDSGSDSEEEGELILGGTDDGEARNILLSENLKTGVSAATSGDNAKDVHPPPLYVLPLYSLLPADQQLRVFSPPPAGSRLCVVATNVAETSITIPGIRYVVDTGLAKEKTYDAQTQVQSFEVGWTSQASANQRMGRAGRTGPGHCYRIFSSAVFNDQFAKFSEPEIMRMPIEGVVLQMKAMCLDNVVNFPFPTPPSQSALAKAERLLAWLGALDTKGCITDLGRLMSVFPVAPRFAKMLIIGQQHGCLPYIIAIVAGLSVGDPFVKEFSLNPDGTDDATLADLSERDYSETATTKEARTMDSGELAAKEHMRLKRKQYWSTQAKLAGADPTSDVLKWLTAIGAYEYSGGTEAACTEYYVRPKAMNEIRKLRGQLTNLVQMYCPGVDIAMDPRMPPPSKLQQSVIRQIVLAGFLDHVAVRGDIAGFHSPDDETAVKKRGIHATPYVTMWSDEPVYLHPESVAYIAARKAGSMPQAIVYSELQHTTRLWAKVVTVVNTKWLATIGQPLCTFGNPLPYPLPKYNDTRDQMTCYVEPRFGPKSWELSMVKVEEKRTGTRWQITKVLG